MERIVKMAAKFNMAAKNHVTPQSSWLGTLNLNKGNNMQSQLTEYNIQLKSGMTNAACSITLHKKSIEKYAV